MNIQRFALNALAALVLWSGVTALHVSAETPAPKTPASTPACVAEFPPLLYTCESDKKILQFGTDGKVQWEYPAEMSRDAWRLPNGNTLFCYNNKYNSKLNDNPSGVMEVTADKKVVFEFKTTGQVWSCQRLADGSTLVGAASQGKLLIVDANGRVTREITVQNKPGHSCMRNARQTANGHFLVAEESARAAREYSADGKLLREMKVPFAPYSAVRLAGGNTLVCGQKSMVEIDAADKVVWSLDDKDVPQLGIRWFAGVQVLPGGNVFICNAGGKIPFAEISREKRVEWQSPPASSGIGLGHGIQRLDVKSSPVK